MNRRNKVLLSFLASLGLHLLLLTCAVLMLGVSGMFPPEPVQGSTPNEVVVYLPELLPEEPLEEAEKKRTPFIRTSEKTRSESAPESPDFESDKNTLAATEKAPDPSVPGEVPLPSAEGLEDMSFMELEDREYVDGEKLNENAAPSSAGAVPVMVAPPTPPTPPTPLKPQMPVTPPAETEPVQVAEASMRPPPIMPEESSFSDALDVIETKPLEERPAEPPEEMVEEPVDDPDKERAEELKTRMAETLPQLEETPPTPPQEEAAPAAPPAAPAVPGDTGYLPETRKTTIRGTLSNRGNAAVNATETPLGRYKAMVSQAIEKLWHRYRQDRADFLEYGSIQLSFEVDRNGKPRKLKILRNDANAVMVDFTLSAILGADIPPMPEEILDILEKESLEVTYDVIIY